MATKNENAHEKNKAQKTPLEDTRKEENTTNHENVYLKKKRTQSNPRFFLWQLQEVNQLVDERRFFTDTVLNTTVKT